jgi:hypothetical protein
LSAGPDEILWEPEGFGAGRECLEELDGMDASADPDVILWEPEEFRAGRECLEELDGMGAGADPDEFLVEPEGFGAGRDPRRSPNLICLNGRIIVTGRGRPVMRTLTRPPPPGTNSSKMPNSCRFRYSPVAVLK